MPKNGSSARKSAARQHAAQTGQAYEQALAQVGDLPARHRGVAQLRREFGARHAVYVLAEDGTEWGPYEIADADADEHAPTGMQAVHAIAVGYWELASRWDDETWSSALPPDARVAVCRTAEFRQHVPGGPHEVRALAALNRIDAELADLPQHGDLDPYRLAALLDGRALVWGQLGHTRPLDPLGQVDRWALAAAYAAILDQEHAARVRTAYRIPTMWPGSQLELLRWEDLRCRSCGRLWQPDDPQACPRCPAVLVGAAATSREQAGELPPGTPYAGPFDITARPTPALRAGSGPRRWESCGSLPPVIDQIARLDSEQISPAWRVLLRALAEARAELTVRQAAHSSALEVTGLLETGPRGTQSTAGSRARITASELGTAAEQARSWYVALAVHALCAAAGEVDPDALPQLAPMGEVGYLEPEPAIPPQLAAHGYPLPAVHAALPDTRVARGLEDDFARAFGRTDDHACEGLLHEGRCTCPISVPGHMTEQAGRRDDEIGLAWEHVASAAVPWADAVGQALCADLLPILRAPR